MPAAAPQKNNNPGEAKLSLITKIIATGFFSGYIPWASGTFGSIVGLLLYCIIPGMEKPELLGSIIILGFIAGVITSAKVAGVVGHSLSSSAELAKKTFQGNTLKPPDPSIVVIDEIVGMWISLLFLPKSLFILILAFIFFRLFDIVKPPPARQLEQLPNGWGIMLDDVMAGIYANLMVRIAIIIFPAISQ